MGGDFTIDYLGKVYRTTIHRDLTDDEYRSVVEGIRSRPSLYEVRSQLASLPHGGDDIGKIYAYYVRDIAYKTRLVYNNWSIDEALRHKPLMEFFAGKVEENKKVFPDTLPLWKKIETAFRLCGFRTCSKPANFPIGAIDSLLRRFCPDGGNYYDFSCGWGTRLLSSLRNRVAYFGTDPNDELVPKLREMADEYRRVCHEEVPSDIRCAGSETFIPEWEGIMDFAFSSPPYFSLEDYRIGEGQSYHEGMEYGEWVSRYVRPTVENCARYLKPGGVFGYNVKNNPKYIPHDMEGDWEDTTLSNGFEPIEVVRMRNGSRVSGHRHSGGENTILVHDGDESIFLYRRLAGK